MPDEKKGKFPWLTVAIVAAQLLYVVIFLVILVLCYQSLGSGSVTASGATLFTIIYLVIMIGANIGWRILVHKKHIVLAAVTVVVAIVINVFIGQLFTLQNAHSSYENYYKFRGCTESVSRSDTSGLCNLPSGETIKIVESHNKWYLDGDLPNGWF